MMRKQKPLKVFTEFLRTVLETEEEKTRRLERVAKRNQERQRINDNLRLMDKMGFVYDYETDLWKGILDGVWVKITNFTVSNPNFDASHYFQKHR